VQLPSIEPGATPRAWLLLFLFSALRSSSLSSLAAESLPTIPLAQQPSHHHHHPPPTLSTFSVGRRPTRGLTLRRGALKPLLPLNCFLQAPFFSSLAYTKSFTIPINLLRLISITSARCKLLRAIDLASWLRLRRG